MLCSAGHNLCFLDLDDDLSVEGLLRGAPTPQQGVVIALPDAG
jgi:hypothetical protein